MTRRTLTTERGLVHFRRTLTSSVLIDVPFQRVKLQVGRDLAALIAEGDADPAAKAVTTVSTRRFPRLSGVAVNVETWSPRSQRAGLLVHLRWRARHYQHLFPVMEADVLARPRTGGKTQLVLEAAYRPPLGTLGLLVDLLVGRLVARSTVEAFLLRLADALEAPVLSRPEPADAAAMVAGPPPVLRHAA